MLSDPLVREVFGFGWVSVEDAAELLIDIEKPDDESLGAHASMSLQHAEQPHAGTVTSMGGPGDAGPSFP